MTKEEFHELFVDLTQIWGELIILQKRADSDILDPWFDLLLEDFEKLHNKMKTHLTNPKICVYYEHETKRKAPQG